MPSNSSQASVSGSLAGPFLVAAAALCWSSDVLFRAPTSKLVHPTFIVLFEHLIGTALLWIWVFFRNREQMRGFSAMTWLSLFLVGAGGSAIATVLYTASFQHINPSVAILLQKLQPVLVIAFAGLLLRETPSKSFWGWSLAALLSAVVVSFPDFNFSFVTQGIDWHSHGVIYAFSAAVLWALATVAGKSAVSHLPPSVVTFWRYVFGLITLIALYFASGESFPVKELQQPEILRALLYMSFVPGILALVCYYNGLSRTTATTTTFIELLSPIGSLVLVWTMLHQPLVPIQMLAGAILLYSVARISLQR